MITKNDAKAIALVMLLGALLAVGAALLLMHFVAPAIQSGIVIGGM